MAKLVCEDCNEVIEENIPEEQAQSMAGDGQAVRDEREDRESEEGVDDSPSSGGLDDRSDPEDIEEEIGDDYEEKVDEMTDDDQVEETLDECEDYIDSEDEYTASSGGGVDFLNEEKDTPIYARWNPVCNQARQIESVLRDKLRQKQRDEWERERRSGRFDSNRMIQADRGNPRVFQQIEEGEDLDYQAFFVLDRSKSMQNDVLVTSSEDATAILMRALEQVGVDTELVDFYQGNARVIKTLSQDLYPQAGAILKGHNHASGGTPLGSTMKLVANRMEERSDKKTFLVVITDGEPGDKEKRICREALEELTEKKIPVLGFTIGNASELSDSKFENLFHNRVNVQAQNKLTTRLEELIRGVVF